MKKILVTGSTGFAGSFLVEYLIWQKKFEISGTYLTERSISNVSSAKNIVNFVQVDLTDSSKVSEVISKISSTN